MPAAELHEAVDYQYDGIYEPREIARYLAATTPHYKSRLTSRRVLRWIRAGIVAPEQRHEPGRSLTLNFDDLVSFQVVTLLREANFSLQYIRKQEELWAKELPMAKPFAHGDFWHDFPHLFLKQGEHFHLPTGQVALQFFEQSAVPVRSGLSFSHEKRATAWRPGSGISLEPAVQFGQPCLGGSRIPTSAIWSLVRGGDRPSYVARCYGVELPDVERALEWEERVRAA